MHDAQPTTGADRPGFGVVARPDSHAVSLLQAPIGIDHQFAGAHADDPEGRQGRQDRREIFPLLREAEGETAAELCRGNRPGRIELQQSEGHECDQRERAYEDDRDQFDELVASDPQQHGGHDSGDDRPQRFVDRFDEILLLGGELGHPEVERVGLRGVTVVTGRGGEDPVASGLVMNPIPFPPGRRHRHTRGERLGDAGEDPPLLHKDEDGHHHPGPVDPAPPGKAWPRHPVEGVQRRAPPGEGGTADLHLGRHLDDAADEDQPQEQESGLGSGGCGGDQLAAADDRTGQYDPGAEMAQRSDEGLRWIDGGAWRFPHGEKKCCGSAAGRESASQKKATGAV